MNRIVLYLFVAFLLVSCTSYSQEYHLKFKDIRDLQKFLTWSPSRVPLVSCHRGGPVPGFPENAIETFANSTKHQPSVIECDAGFTKDSVLVMLHDDRLERTTTGSGDLNDRLFADLKNVRLKDNDGKVTRYHIPTLDAVLKWGRDKVLFTLDIKRGVPYKNLINAVRRNRAEAYSIIITYNANQAAEVHKLAPDLMISASVKSREDLERLNSMGVPNNRIVAFVGVAQPDRTLCDYLHSKGIFCILGTMGNLDNKAKARGEDVYSGLIEAGADILSSDRTEECGRELMQYSKEKGLKSTNIVMPGK